MVSYFAVLFSHEMSWMRSGIELSQFLRFFPTYFSDLLIIVLDIMPFQMKLFFSRKSFFFF